jgi:cytoskeletal protein CcmA (bactofilin family)
MKQCQRLLLALIMLVLAAIPVLAAPWEIRSGAATIAADRVIAGDLIFNGDQLEIEGTVNGDLLVFAREVTITGRVNGSVLGIVSDQLTVNGIVAGNLRAVAATLTLNGQVERNLSAYALRMTAAPHSRIAGGILGIYGELKLTGTVNGPIAVKAYSSNRLGGSVGGNVTVKGAPLKWLPPVRIAGRVDDYTGTTPPKNQQVMLGKGFHSHQPVTALPRYNKYFVLVSLIWFLGNLLMSLIFYRIFPRTAWRITQPTMTMVKRSFVTGLLTLIVVPVMIFLLVISTVGLPIALVLILLYIVFLLFANVPVSLLLGRIAMRQYGPDYPRRPSLVIVIGCLAAGMIGILPVLGFILSSCIGVGMLIRNIRPEYKEI